MIKIRGLSKRYGDFEALRNVNLDVAPGEFLVVLGPSGAGKSTLLRCINRLCTPSQGEVHVDGLRVEAGGTMPALLSWLQIFPRRDIDIAMECLRRVELAGKADLRTDTLSGGQKQRVGIARALAQQPLVILADEPVASLDPKTSRTVLTYLKQASRELGISVVCNLHQIDYACEFGERIVGVSGGRIVFDGRPDGLTPEVLRRIYPGLDDGAATGSAGRARPSSPPHNLTLEEA